MSQNPSARKRPDAPPALAAKGAALPAQPQKWLPDNVGRNPLKVSGAGPSLMSPTKPAMQGGPSMAKVPAYFKDNIADPQEQEEYDPTMYYYHRDKESMSGPTSKPMLSHPGMGAPPNSMMMGGNDVNRFGPGGYGGMPGPSFPTGSGMYPMAQTVNPMGGVALPPGVSSAGGPRVNQPQILPNAVNSSVPPNMRMPAQVPPSAGMSMSSHGGPNPLRMSSGQTLVQTQQPPSTRVLSASATGIPTGSNASMLGGVAMVGGSGAPNMASSISRPPASNVMPPGGMPPNAQMTANGSRVLMRERSYSGGNGSSRPPALGSGMPMGALGGNSGMGMVGGPMGMPPASSAQPQPPRGGPGMSGFGAGGGPVVVAPYNLMSKSSGSVPPMMGGMYPGSLDSREKETPAFDISDFPALANRPLSSNSSSSSVSSPTAEFHTEDFPALPSAGFAGGASAAKPAAAVVKAKAAGQAQHAPAGLPVGGLHPGASPSASGSGVSSGSSGAAASGGNGVDRFGLLGLLSVIRMTDPDLNVLALGTDLTTLGLNLNSPEVLYPTFTSPWTDSNTPRRFEPAENFYLPPCYFMQAPMQPPHLKIHLFSDETLFYIFYAMPRDVLQVYASHELYNRDWRYHKELQRWFTRVQGTEPSIKTQTYERGSYIYYDFNTGEKVRKDNFVLQYEALEERRELNASGSV